MEPISALGRVRDVPRAVAGEPPPDGVGVDAVLDVPPSFGAFYGASRDQVGRALAVTLRDAELAADAVDEAMARAYQHWPKVGRLDNPAGWVYRVGLNYARSRVRRRRGREHLMHHAGDTEPTTSEPAVVAALERLPVGQRAVVVCRYLFGWSEAETAVALGIRPGTAKSRLHRALGTLQAELHHLRPEEPS